jgi:hypothetical protein
MYFRLEDGGGGVTGFVLESQSRQSAKHFLQSSELELPHPLTHRRVCPPLWFRGRNSSDEETDFGTLGIYGPSGVQYEGGVSYVRV